MNTFDAIRSVLDTSQFLLTTYLKDFSDQDILVRPVKGANHIAWQLGHLISSEHKIIAGIHPSSSSPLPDPFLAAHTKATATSDDASQFFTLQEYMDHFSTQRGATKRALEQISEAEMDKPAPEAMRNYCPTVGDALLLCGNHILMHIGQIVIVRRLLNKPVII